MADLAPWLPEFLTGIAAAVAALMLASLYRAAKGPRSADRLIAVNVLTTKTIVLLTLVSAISSQYSFLDVAVAFALMGFATTVVVLKAVLKGRLY